MHARGIGMVVQELMQPELHGKPGRAFGRRRGDSRFHHCEFFMRRGDSLLGFGLDGFKRLKLLLE